MAGKQTEPQIRNTFCSEKEYREETHQEMR